MCRDPLQLTLREQGVDSANLHTGATAAIAQFRGVNVIPPVRSKERQGREPVDILFSRSVKSNDSRLAGFQRAQIREGPLASV